MPHNLGARGGSATGIHAYVAAGSYTATLTVTDTVPLASVLICGDTPSAYASNFD